MQSAVDGREQSLLWKIQIQKLSGRLRGVGICRCVLPLGGPTLLAVRPFKDANEKAEATMAAIAGLQLAMRPDLWQDYPAAQARALQVALPLAQLRQRYPDQGALIDGAVQATGQPEVQLRYLPMQSRKASWTVLLDARTAQPVGYLPLDAF